MGAGGWNLIHIWLTDAIVVKNWALIEELLELLLLCPVDIERLKSNNCPKLIKGLSKEGSHQDVRCLASRLVEQWLKIVKGEAPPNSVPAQIMTVSTPAIVAPEGTPSPPTQQANAVITSAASQVVVTTATPVQETESASIVSKIEIKQESDEIVNKSPQPPKKSSFVVVTSSPSQSPVCKITIRDGKQVLAQVETDASNINNIKMESESNGEVLTDKVVVKEEVDDSKQLEDKAEKLTEQVSNQVVEQEVVVGGKSENDVDTSVKPSKDNKDSSDSNKSVSDKENRDSHKKDDKKSSSSSSSSGSDKKSSHHSSSASKSSSKHGSHRSSSHRSGSSSKSSSSSSSSKDKSSRDRDKEKDKHHSSSSSSSSTKSKSKSEREKEKEKEKEKLKKEQADKDRSTLEKVQGQALGAKLGKIPKKKPEDEKTQDVKKPVNSESKDSCKENKDKTIDEKAKKLAQIAEKKNISISIENRKNSQEAASRPKTVKTFNSKFRSTGLEEEIKPPPPRSAAKKPNPLADKKIVPPKLPPLKRPSPLREVTPVGEKKLKLALDSPPSDEKKGGIKLIKPKPMVLQESDMFMDALTASTKTKEPRKRKRKTSSSKEGASDPKKQEASVSESIKESASPPSSPPPTTQNSDDKSLLTLKPDFKFYQDTLETEGDKEERMKLRSSNKKCKEEEVDVKPAKEDIDENNRSPSPDEDSDDAKIADSSEDPAAEVADAIQKESEIVNHEMPQASGLKSVLLLQKRKGPKKSLKWKTDLESIRYFELDETERVNVTKTFSDMKIMEKQNEREAFIMARKLCNEDLMEEKTRWKPLIPIDLPPPLVEPGKDSREKDIQYAREKGILQALYLNRSMIPDSAAEPDEERHHVTTDPKIIPLDDLTGNKDSEKDFTNVPWPEPKGQLVPPQATPITNYHYHQMYPTNQHQAPHQPPTIPMVTQPTVGPPMTQPMMNPMGGPMGAPDATVAAIAPVSGSGGGWRTGDGKVVVPDVGMNPMNPAVPPGGFPPQGMEGGPIMGPPGMMGPPIFNQQDGYGMMGPEEMGYNFQAMPPPMYGPVPPGPNFQGPRMPPSQMHAATRGRGGPPGWFPRGGPPVRGSGWRGAWRGSTKQPPVCRQFAKSGYCRVGDKCQFLHPGFTPY